MRKREIEKERVSKGVCVSIQQQRSSIMRPLSSVTSRQLFICSVFVSVYGVRVSPRVCVCPRRSETACVCVHNPCNLYIISIIHTHGTATAQLLCMCSVCVCACVCPPLSLAPVSRALSLHGALRQHNAVHLLGVFVCVHACVHVSVHVHVCACS